jgi:hypothetical protein
MFTKAPEVSSNGNKMAPNDLSENTDNIIETGKKNTDDILTMPELMEHISLLENNLTTGKEIKNLERDDNYPKEN